MGLQLEGRLAAYARVHSIDVTAPLAWDANGSFAGQWCSLRTA